MRYLKTRKYHTNSLNELVYVAHDSSTVVMRDKHGELHTSKHKDVFLTPLEPEVEAINTIRSGAAKKNFKQHIDDMRELGFKITFERVNNE